MIKAVKLLKGSYTPDTRTRQIISQAAWCGIAVFFFILLFQPFGLPDAELIDTLILVAGMGLITFLSLIVFLVILPWIFPKLFQTGEWEEGPPDLLNLTAWFFSATGMTFYVRFVADTSLSIPTVVRIVLVCLAPSIYFRVKMHIAALRLSIERHKKPYAKEASPVTQRITIHSDSGTESMDMSSDKLLYIKAADNYVEVVEIDDGSVQTRLIRTTLKKVRMDLNSLPGILQCHRAYIINTEKVEKLYKSPNGYTIDMIGVPESIPVSRAYQIRVKEAFEA